MLPYGKQTIEQDDIDAVTQALKHDFLTTGPKVAEFEAVLAKVTGASEAVAVGNGTQALHLACLACDISAGDYAIVPSVTFLATANAIRYCGAEVLFCDVDPTTGLMDVNYLNQLLDTHKDKNIKAVLPVHLGGQLADLKAIRDLSKTYDFKVIADSCHALGTEMEDYNVGSCGLEDMATFSFHPVKTIAMGEGGAITLNDAELAKKMRLMRSHGMEPTPQNGLWAYEMQELGYNYRVTDIQCALGVSQLKKLDRFIEKRRTLARLYDERLKPLSPVILPPQRIEAQNPAWHLYAVRINFDMLDVSKDQLMKILKEHKIGAQVHYIPVHSQPYYKNRYGEQLLPGAEQYYSQTLSLPLFPAMEESEVEYVVETLETVCAL